MSPVITTEKSPLEIRIVVLPDLVAEICLTNKSDRRLRLGTPNEANVSVQGMAPPQEFVSPWVHAFMIPNDEPVFSLEPGASWTETFDLARNYLFTHAGNYCIYLIYNSMSYGRFAGIRELGTVDLICSRSEIVEFFVDQSVIDRDLVGERVREVFGDFMRRSATPASWWSIFMKLWRRRDQSTEE